MDIYLGEAEDMVIKYGLQKCLDICPRGWQMGASCWWLRDASADGDRHCCAGVSVLEGLPLALPDGHKRVASSGPQVAFVPFSGLPHFLGSNAEPGVLELATVMTVKQAAIELEHHGDVWMTATHRQVPQAELHLRSIVGMQQALHPTEFHLVGQPLEWGPAVALPIAVGRALGIQAIAQLTQDLSSLMGMSCAMAHGWSELASKPTRVRQGSALVP